MINLPNLVIKDVDNYINMELIYPVIYHYLIISIITIVVIINQFRIIKPR